ncbi:beta-phosphoglucomutase [Peptostreptococcus canis]|uniref:Beta-phosphoglucomutase n=1 Tax=Peptostreptococcus canis TaxID=1159213 RepID=A0ABR6TN64_9FIRM|nr:beta-phosphoglucomutase [Peptostreptococcus canis]MBC2576862.1 beta-phosphoglucomutase [Peptostreptococcus canis]MBP1998630.1 beta-phosphoglucomutase [Peptostreptococcus canis]
MIRGIIFDLDGVITDTAKFHYAAWKSLASELGIEIDEKFNEKLKGISRIESLEKILDYGGIREKYSDDEINSLAQKKNEEYKKLLKSLDRKDILPGISEFIDELRENNIKIGLASVSKNAPIILEKLGLMEKIDFIADPSKVEKGKPAPDIFIEAARGIGIEIEEVIGIEDSDAGVKAMKNCKMKSIGIGVEADISLSCTSELSLDLIKKFNK